MSCDLCGRERRPILSYCCSVCHVELGEVERISMIDPSLLTLGNTVTAETPHGPMPGILIGVEEDDYRVLVAYPGENGHVSAITLPIEKLS